MFKLAQRMQRYSWPIAASVLDDLRQFLEHGIAQEDDYRCAAIVDLCFSQHSEAFILDGLVVSPARVSSYDCELFCSGRWQ